MERFEILTSGETTEIKYHPTFWDIGGSIIAAIRVLAACGLFVFILISFLSNMGEGYFLLVILPFIGWAAVLFSQILIEDIRMKKGIIVKATKGKLEIYGKEIDVPKVYRIEHGIKYDRVSELTSSKSHNVTCGRIDFIDRKGESIVTIPVLDSRLHKRKRDWSFGISVDEVTNKDSKWNKRRETNKFEMDRLKNVTKTVAMIISEASGIQARRKHHKS